MRRIALTRGQFALVDDEDYECVNQFKWYAEKHPHTYYAARAVVEGERQFIVYMHNFLIGGRTDHIAPNSGLDNRRVNLRLATYSQNARAFQGKRPGCTSRHRGVSWDKRASKWRAQIKAASGKVVNLGLFQSEIVAARVYNVAAKLRDPIFHHLNQV